jgi:hypothetical protein
MDFALINLTRHEYHFVGVHFLLFPRWSVKADYHEWLGTFTLRFMDTRGKEQYGCRCGSKINICRYISQTLYTWNRSKELKESRTADGNWFVFKIHILPFFLKS